MAYNNTRSGGSWNNGGGDQRGSWNNGGGDQRGSWGNGGGDQRGGSWNNGGAYQRGGPRNGRYNGYSNGYGNFGSNQRNNDPVVFEIREHIGVLTVKESGWRKEVNSVAWNGNPPKIDIREWSPDYEAMSRGITLHEAEAARLCSLLASRYWCGNSVAPLHEGTPRPVHAAPGDVSMMPDAPFLPEDSPGELYEDESDDTDCSAAAGEIPCTSDAGDELDTYDEGTGEMA